LPPKGGDADLLIRQGLLAKWRSRRSYGMLNLKDLLTASFGERGSTFSGFAEPSQRIDVDLVDSKWIIIPAAVDSRKSA
jgi:hypothetical protein